MSALLRRLRRDDGIGLIVVVLFAIMVMALSAVAVGIAHQSARSSSQHVSFESAMGAADTGVAAVLSSLKSTSGFATTGVTSPGSFASVDAERSWARTQLLALAPANLKSIQGAQYVAMRPGGAQTIYALSWSPSYDAFVNKHSRSAKQRLIKVDYAFTPMNPGQAIVTQGQLDVVGGSVSVLKAPDGSAAGIHTESNFTNTSNSLTIQGPVTAVGTVPAGSFSGVASMTGSSPSISVPTVRARYYWDQYAKAYGGFDANGDYSGNFYELCPDGTVHGVASTATQPCSCPAAVSCVLSSAGSTFQGWSFSSGTWTMKDASPFLGIYYAYQSDIAVVAQGSSTKGSPWRTSIFAESMRSGAGSCTKSGGNISWKGVSAVNFLQGLVMVADANLDLTANLVIGDGLFGAADRIHLSTSSDGITGYVVSNDECPSVTDTNQIQGITLNYDPTAAALFQGSIRAVQWLDLRS